MMRKLLFSMLFVGANFIGFSQSTSKTGKIVISYNNLESSTGNVMVKLYDSNSAEFPDTKSAIAIKTVKIDKKQATVTFENLPYGKYAFTTFHDENENGKMDTNKIYLPKEGYAFSNNLKIMFGPPSFEKASFNLSKKVLDIKVTLSY